MPVNTGDIAPYESRWYILYNTISASNKTSDWEPIFFYFQANLIEPSSVPSRNRVFGLRVRFVPSSHVLCYIGNRTRLLELKYQPMLCEHFFWKSFKMFNFDFSVLSFPAGRTGTGSFGHREEHGHAGRRRVRNATGNDCRDLHSADRAHRCVRHTVIRSQTVAQGGRTVRKTYRIQNVQLKNAIKY